MLKTPTKLNGYSETPVHIWEPFKDLNINCLKKQNEKKSAFIILNSRIGKKNERQFTLMWDNASVRICVDGGANRLYEWFSSKKIIENITQKIFIPDYICGDLDSIEPHVLDYYASKGSKCIRLVNQDLTDFTKSLKFTVSCVKEGVVDSNLITESKEYGKHYYAKNSQLNENLISELTTKFMQENMSKVHIEEIFCFADFGGRLDHAIAILNSLFDVCLKNIKTFIMGSESMTFLLRKGINIIYLDNYEIWNGKYCGLLPIGGSAYVTSHGLKWNLNNQLSQFGELVSTSNELNDEEIVSMTKERAFLNNGYDSSRKHIRIQTDQPIVWTMSII